MKNLFISCVLIFSAMANAADIEKVCGKVEAAVWDGSLLINIADLQSYQNKQQNFEVLNPLAFEWQAGSCICVEGMVQYDPTQGQNYLYQQIVVSKKISEDTSGKSCRPRKIN